MRGKAGRMVGRGRPPAGDREAEAGCRRLLRINQ